MLSSNSSLLFEDLPFLQVVNLSLTVVNFFSLSKSDLLPTPPF